MIQVPWWLGWMIAFLSMYGSLSLVASIRAAYRSARRNDIQDLIDDDEAVVSDAPANVLQIPKERTWGEIVGAVRTEDPVASYISGTMQHGRHRSPKVS